MWIWCTSSSTASSITPRSRCTSTTCAATTRTTSARRSSRRSRARCAWPWRAMRARKVPFPRPRGHCSSIVARIAVVDYGMGNLRSVAKALEHVAPRATIAVTADAEVIRAAERVVVPGQGALPDCMKNLAASGARDAVLEALREKPYLGICLGLQMLFEHGAEGDTTGLGVLQGDVPRLAVGGLKIPHMGWNEVQQESPHPLWAGISDKSRFYFVH